MATTKSDGHLILTFNNGDLMPMLKNTDNRIENFTPIAIMAIDRQLMLSGKKTKYASFEEAIKAAKAGTPVAIGGSKGDDELVYSMLLESTGLTELQMPYILHDATSEALTALLGGHIEYAISKPAACLQYIKSGDMKPAVALTKTRFDGELKDVPMLSEIGAYKDVEVPVWRGLVGPKDMPAEAVAFWGEAMKKISESEAFKKNYLEKNMLSSFYKTPEEAKAYMTEYQANYLKSIGK